MWFRKKQLSSEEYLKLLHKFAELTTEVEILSSEIKIISNRKWGEKRKKAEPQELKSIDGLDSCRGFPENDRGD